VFDTLSDRLSAVFTNLRGKGRLSDADIDASASRCSRPTSRCPWCASSSPR
jgi:signal recognition particle GTPase